MGWLDGVLFAYAVLSIGGGIDGYLAKHSMGSLMGGGISGLLILAGIAIARKNPSVGYGLAAFLTLAMTGFFVMRYFTKGHAVWPALVMIIAGVATLGCLVAGHLMKKPTP